jgi:squalene-hopene/tetraprenyl-beta-curcumene cyclase
MTTLARAGDLDANGQVRRAIGYLDSRQETWSKFGGSARGTGEDKTTCLSCHTGISYAITRHLLGGFIESPGFSAFEDKMIGDVTRRVTHWNELDSPRFRLMYDHDDQKKVESQGTEAVLDALILTRDDQLRGRAEPSETTRSSLAHLWMSQKTEGAEAGSWDWLNFGLEPWEGDGSPAFGASLAAIAVGSAPGYLEGPVDDRSKQGVERLRGYLIRRFPQESLHNRLWIIEASSRFKDLAEPAQIRTVVAELKAAQREDGGWSLARFGDFQRVDNSKPNETSDGYATGLAVHTLLKAGEPADRPEITRAVDWLRKHQREDGSWPGISVNKERDPSTFAGKLMTDAATAFAARGLVEAGAK